MGAVSLGLGLALLALGRAHWRGGLIAAGWAQLLSGAALLSMAARARARGSGPLPPADLRSVLLLSAAAPATLGASWGLAYILPVRAPGPAWLGGMAAFSALGGLGAALAARYFQSSQPHGLAAAAAAWARSSAAQQGLATLGLLATLLAGLPQGRWAALAPVEVSLSLAQLGAVLLLSAEALGRAAPALWRWWRLRDPAPLRSPPVAAQLWSLRLIFGQNNPLRAIFAGVRAALGLDLRGSWALEVLRRAAEPALVGALLFSWMISSLAMIHPDEQGMVERFGRMLDRPPLEPGLHLLAPWPIDRVRRAPVRRVASIFIGHGEEPEAADAGAPAPAREGGEAATPEEGPESRLWARQHGKEEFTLLLGDGRELISLDGRLHYKINDLRAWLSASQNPEATLEALTYEAVTRQTVDQTLDAVLSASVRALSAEVQAEVQRAADARGLGVTVVEFTFTAMHPPVAVAVEYQSVVSAEIDRQTRVVRARAAAAQGLPQARAEAHRARSEAEAAAVLRLAGARADAAAFEGLRASARGDEALYRLRRQLEAIELQLSDTPLIILDHRIEGQGGELWLKP